MDYLAALVFGERIGTPSEKLRGNALRDAPLLAESFNFPTRPKAQLFFLGVSVGHFVAFSLSREDNLFTTKRTLRIVKIVNLERRAFELYDSVAHARSENSRLTSWT